MTNTQSPAPNHPGERIMSYGKRTRLLGILSYAHPASTEAKPRSTCVILLNAGVVRKVGPGRLNVELARRIAKSGMDTFRFDFAGVGDSPERTDGKGLAEGVITDVQETMDHLERTLGYQRFVVMGLCSGADNGMRAAEQDDRIVAVAMFDPTIDRTPRWYWEAVKVRLTSFKYLRKTMTLRNRFLRRLLGLTTEAREPGDGAGEQPELYQVTYADRASITQCLNTLMAREVRLFVTFTGSWDFIYNYESQFLDVYRCVPFANRLNLSFRPQSDHSFLDSQHRNELFDDLTDWCRQLA